MAGLIMTGQRFATLSNLDMQQCPKMFCNFVQKVLAKNSYILYIVLKDKEIDSNTIEKAVRKWIVITLLTGRYSGSPESAFDYDIKRFFKVKSPFEYISSIEEGELSEAYWNSVLLTRLNTSVASSPYYNIYLMAQIKSHDFGFLSSDITIQALVENIGDTHHLFPKKYLQKNGFINRGEYNQIANYALTQSEINIKIKDKAPKEYMNIIENQIKNLKPIICNIIQQDKLQNNLKRNCIPPQFDQYDYKDYPTFLQQRRRLMAKKIQEYYYSL